MLKLIEKHSKTTQSAQSRHPVPPSITKEATPFTINRNGLSTNLLDRSSESSMRKIYSAQLISKAPPPASQPKNSPHRVEEESQQKVIQGKKTQVVNLEEQNPHSKQTIPPAELRLINLKKAREAQQNMKLSKAPSGKLAIREVFKPIGSQKNTHIGFKKYENGDIKFKAENDPKEEKLPLMEEEEDNNTGIHI